MCMHMYMCMYMYPTKVYDQILRNCCSDFKDEEQDAEIAIREHHATVQHGGRKQTVCTARAADHLLSAHAHRDEVRGGTTLQYILLDPKSVVESISEVPMHRA